MVKFIDGFFLFVTFSSIKADGTLTTYYSTNWGYIRGFQSGKCIDISGVSLENDAAATIYNCFFLQQNQQFSESAIQLIQSDSVSGSQEYHYLTARHSGKCFAVKGAGTANNIPVIQYTCDSTVADAAQTQLFAKIPSSRTGYYQLKDFNSGRCVSVADFSSTNGAHLVIFDCNDAPNQQWSDIYVNV